MKSVVHRDKANNQVLTSSPATDLRYCGIPQIVAAVESLGPAAAGSPQLAAYLESYGVGHDAASSAAAALAEAFAMAVDDPDLTLDRAVERAGFAACPLPVQSAVLAQIGRAFLAATLHAVRITTPLDSWPQFAEGLKAAAGRAADAAMDAGAPRLADG